MIPPACHAAGSGMVAASKPSATIAVHKVLMVLSTGWQRLAC
jgi:hypothetical protein